MRIHGNEVENIAECNLLHDIINTPKCTKNLNGHYSTILYGCMNTRKGKEWFKKSLILLESRCSPTILILRLVKKLHP